MLHGAPAASQPCTATAAVSTQENDLCGSRPMTLSSTRSPVSPLAPSILATGPPSLELDAAPPMGVAR
eukprot:3240331-Pyramimonas_sp.AAC.1